MAPPAPAAVDHQGEQLPAAPPAPASSWTLPPRPPGAAPLSGLDTVERDASTGGTVYLLIFASLWR